MESKADIRRRVRALMKEYAARHSEGEARRISSASEPSCHSEDASRHSERTRRISSARSIWSLAESLPTFPTAKTILIYCALPDEVPTADAIARWSSAGKRIVLPLVTGETLLLKEYDPAKLHCGSFGIMEPDADAATVDPAEIELAFIPGVAFDRSGMRLGRGKGFYDRLLPSLSCPLVGVCHDFQLLDSPIPADPWDRPMDLVLTEPTRP